jgi:hypothetical protein
MESVHVLVNKVLHRRPFTKRMAALRPIKVVSRQQTLKHRRVVRLNFTPALDWLSTLDATLI